MVLAAGLPEIETRAVVALQVGVAAVMVKATGASFTVMETSSKQDKSDAVQRNILVPVANPVTLEVKLEGVVMVPEPLILDQVPVAGAVAASVVDVAPHNA